MRKSIAVALLLSLGTLSEAYAKRSYSYLDEHCAGLPLVVECSNTHPGQELTKEGNEGEKAALCAGNYLALATSGDGRGQAFRKDRGRFVGFKAVVEKEVVQDWKVIAKYKKDVGIEFPDLPLNQVYPTTVPGFIIHDGVSQRAICKVYMRYWM